MIDLLPDACAVKEVFTLNTRGMSKEARQQAHNDVVASILSKGNNILLLLAAANGSYGKLALDECAISMGLGVVSLYWLCILMINLTKHGLNVLVITALVANLLVFGVSFYRLCFTVSHGQAIEDEVSDVVNVLRDKLADDYEFLTPEQRFKLTLLKEKFQDARGISPRKIFWLNHAMILTACSTLLTYLIVLIQFKAAESHTP